MRKDKILTVPNFLSLYRLLSFPVVLFFIIKGNEKIFIVLLTINFITDFLDGFIARNFNQETEFGAKLDSLADEGSYILALTGLYVFKRAELEPYLIPILIFFILYFLSLLISLVKFRKLPSLHLYTSKVGAFIEGVFIVSLFIIGFIEILFYLAVIWGVVSFLEQIIIMFMVPEMKSDYKGLYWILKK